MGMNKTLMRFTPEFNGPNRHTSVGVHPLFIHYVETLPHRGRIWSKS